MEQITLSEPIKAIRCDHDGLKMAEIKDGHLILRAKHHGETHIKIVPLGEVRDVLFIPPKNNSFLSPNKLGYTHSGFWLQMS